MEAAVRVITVDDHPMFLDVARQVIGATPGFEAVGEAACGADGVAMASEMHPDIVLMDVRLPGMNGFEAARRILDAHATRLVVFLSTDPVAAPPDLAGSTAIRKEHLCPGALRRAWEQSAQTA